ncbi:MAG: AMP-binding protein [Pseudomonadota bacterium]
MQLPDLNFGDIYEAVAATFPDRTALVYGDIRYTWRQLETFSNRLVRHLNAAGLRPDSKIAFYLQNSPAYAILWNACAKGRFVHANVNYRYVEEELYFLLDNSDAQAVAYDAQFRVQVEQLKPRLPKVLVWLEVSEGEPPSYADSFYRACLDGDGSALDIRRSGDDLYFMYTGGTTGYPKAVMWPARERIAVIGMSSSATVDDHINELKRSSEIPVLLSAAPMMHSTGLTSLMSVMTQGGCIVIPPMEKFDPALCLRSIDENQVSRLAIVGDAFGVPLLQALRDHPDAYDLSSVRLISSAGTIWSAENKAGLLEYFVNATLSDSLGSSEGSRLGGSVTKRGEATGTGRFQLGPDAKVFREDLTEILAGSEEPGLLATSGPLPLGYYKDPEKTAQTFPVIDGVRYSMAGDWVKVAADGTMELLGRGSHCINTGGEKVFPEEVEEALKRIPEIIDAAVIGLPDERFGQAVTALVRTRGNVPVELGSLRTKLEKQIARYKHPKALYVVTDEIRHENGKMNYRAVKKIAGRIRGDLKVLVDDR